MIDRKPPWICLPCYADLVTSPDVTVLERLLEAEPLPLRVRAR